MALRVLVVDDHEINRRLVEHVLVARGFVVDAAGNGTEALGAIERQRPDLVVLDVIMPGLSGIEVLERLKSSPQFTSLPVIMLTACATYDDLLAGYQAGADYFLNKPLVPQQLLYGVSLVLGRRMADPAGVLPRPTRSRTPRRAAAERD